ncbi:MAG: hypothetical protein NC218_03465 [Acetobacter sp.]|nr:hypothetical protein [Acetobacter sp.]
MGVQHSGNLEVTFNINGYPRWDNGRNGYVLDANAYGNAVIFNTVAKLDPSGATDENGYYFNNMMRVWARATTRGGFTGSSVNAPVFLPCDNNASGGRNRVIPGTTFPASYGAYVAGFSNTISCHVQAPPIASVNGIEMFDCGTGNQYVDYCTANFNFVIPTKGWYNCGGVSKNGDSITWSKGSVGYGTYGVLASDRVNVATRGINRHFFLYRKAGGAWQSVQEGGDACTVRGLEPCTTYECAVQAESAACNSAWGVFLLQVTSMAQRLGFQAGRKTSGYWSYGTDYGINGICSIKTDCATPPVFGAYSASATGQTTGRFSWSLSSPGDYCTYNWVKVYLKREIESDDSYRLIQTWGADTYGSGTLSGLVPGERYVVKFVARNSWGTQGYGLETTVTRSFRTQYPVGTYDGPYSNGEPGDTRWDYENVSTFDTSRWNMVVQMPNNSDNARLARVKGTIVGTNDVNGRRDSITWSLFNRSTAEMTSTILNDLGLSSIPLTGSGTLYAPTGNDLVIDQNTHVTSSIVLPGGNNGTNTGSIMNHRLWVKKSTDAWSSVKANNYSYRTNGNNKSVTWDLSKENYLPNTVYNLRSVVTNNVGMYTVTEANLYPPAYGGQHVITPIPTGTPDEPRVEITSCVTNTGGLDNFDSADIKYHVFEGRAQNATEWTQFGRGGEGELCYKVETALPKLECNQNYIIRVTVYNKHNLSVRTEYVLTPPQDIQITASTHNEIGIGYFKTNAVSSGSARVAKRETFWRKETDTEWLVAEIDYTVTTADVETRTPRVLEHETVYRGFVRMTNEYGLCANSTQVVWTTLPRYRLWDNIFRQGTIRAKQRPRVRNSNGTVLDSQNVYWIAANALSNQRVGFPIKDCKLRFPKGWHSGTQYECWRVTFEDGRYIAFENSTKGFNNYVYSSYGYYEKDGTLIAEFYNERDKWLMDEYVLPEECYVASFTAQYASGAERGVRQSSILNRTEVIGSWL